MAYFSKQAREREREKQDAGDFIIVAPKKDRLKNEEVEAI